MRSGEIQPDSLKYQADLALDSIAFEPDIFLLVKAKCEAILEKRRSDEEAKIKEKQTEIPSEEIPPSFNWQEVVIQKDTSKTETGYKQVCLVISGVPASKIADVNRGVLLPLIRAAGGLNLPLKST